MGRDKSLLPFASYDTLTEYQLQRLQKIFKSVYISCKDKNKFDFQATFIEDIDSKDIYAPTTGFLAIYKQLKVESFFVLSVDTPFITEQEINLLVKKDKESFDATIAVTEKGLQPMCGIYHYTLEKEFQKMFEQNNHKLGFLLKHSNTNYVKFSSESFMNLNFIDEYEQALQKIKLR